MSPAERMGLPGPPDFPRVSGDEPEKAQGTPANLTFSPRERG